MTSFLGKIKNKIKNTTSLCRTWLEDVRFSGISSGISKKELLVIKVDSIGDYIIFRNFLKSLKESKKFRDYKLILLGNVWYKEFAEYFDRGIVDEFIWVDLHQIKYPKEFTRLVKRLRSARYEYAISPVYSSAIEDVRLLALCGARYKILHKGDDLHLSVKARAKYTAGAHVIDTGDRSDFEFYRYHDFFQKLLGEELKIKDSHIEMPASEDRTILICPGANSDLRKWPADMFAKLIDRIQNEYPGHTFHIVGSAGDRNMGDDIMHSCSHKDVYNDCGKFDLVELTKSIAGCGLFISNDTGPYHIAMALNKKTVCISNGNNYGRFTPYPAELAKNAVTVVSDKIEKLMTDQANVRLFQSRVSEEKMSEIPVEKVFNAVKKLLS
jgi:ADP-heptose:LPS heptosyltransferase